MVPNNVPDVDWFQVGMSSVAIGAGLMFVFSPTRLLKILDFARVVLGGRSMAWFYRNNPYSEYNPGDPDEYNQSDVVSRSPQLKLGYRIGGVLMTILGILLLFRALGN